MASSKPVATAVVGPGGLAVARPIATAIAGISPSEVSGLGISIGHKHKKNIYSRNNFGQSKHYGLADGLLSNGKGLLVGPDYQSRISETNIPAMEENKIAVEPVAVPQQASVESQIPQFLNPNTFPPAFNAIAPQYQNGGPQPQNPGPYPFIPPTLPFRFNWQTEPESSPGYEPIPFMHNRAFPRPPLPGYFPFPGQQPESPVLNPYRFFNNY